MTGVYLVAGIVGVLLIYVMGTYNALVRLRQHVGESWSDIDTELKRRYDLIPNLVETVKGYATHEAKTLQAVVDARARAVASTGTPETQAADETMLVAALRQLFAVVEAYPDLKANQGFLQLQEELTVTENRIQAARRIYNGEFRAFNTPIDGLQSDADASLFFLPGAEFLEDEEAACAVACA